MVMNPFVLLFLLYFAANLVSTIQGIISGGIELEGTFFKIMPDSFVVAFVVQLSVLLFMFLVYKLLCPTALRIEKFSIRPPFSFFLLSIQTGFMLFNISQGVNVAGVGATIEGGSLLNYAFVILQPDLLYALTAVSMASSRLFYANTFIFLLSMFLRGWMGGVFIVFFIFLARYYPVKLSVRNAVKIMFAFVIVMALMPYIIYAKWAMRTGSEFNEFLSMIPQVLELVDYSYAAGYLLNRFQHVGHVALLYENSSEMLKNYIDGSFSSFWFDGLPQYLVIKFFGFEFYRINSFMVEFFFGIEDPTWNTNPGIAGWFVFLQEYVLLVVFYLVLMFLFPVYFVAKFGGMKLLILCMCFSVLYLFHGWFGAYFNFILYAVVIVFFGRLKSSIK